MKFNKYNLQGKTIRISNSYYTDKISTYRYLRRKALVVNTYAKLISDLLRLYSCEPPRCERAQEQKDYGVNYRQ